MMRLRSIKLRSLPESQWIAHLEYSPELLRHPTSHPVQWRSLHAWLTVAHPGQPAGSRWFLWRERLAFHQGTECGLSAIPRCLHYLIKINKILVIHERNEVHLSFENHK